MGRWSTLQTFMLFQLFFFLKAIMNNVLSLLWEVEILWCNLNVSLDSCRGRHVENRLWSIWAVANCVAKLTSDLEKFNSCSQMLYRRRKITHPTLSIMFLQTPYLTFCYLTIQTITHRKTAHSRGISTLLTITDSIQIVWIKSNYFYSLKPQLMKSTLHILIIMANTK